MSSARIILLFILQLIEGYKQNKLLKFLLSISQAFAKPIMNCICFANKLRIKKPIMKAIQNLISDTSQQLLFNRFSTFTCQNCSRLFWFYAMEESKESCQRKRPPRLTSFQQSSYGTAASKPILIAFQHLQQRYRLQLLITTLQCILFRNKAKQKRLY